eukprot:1392017-Amorphochlora_amoeboformis.AAC.1
MSQVTHRSLVANAMSQVVAITMSQVTHRSLLRSGSRLGLGSGWGWVGVRIGVWVFVIARSLAGLAVPNRR